MSGIGIDVSNNNGTVIKGSAINWDLAREHVDFVIIKASQGTGFRDLEYRRNRDQCGRPNGAYHWLEPAEVYGESVEPQLDLFYEMIGPALPGDIRPSIDVEATREGGGRRVGIPSDLDVCRFADGVEQRWGVTPLLYGGQFVLQPMARRCPELLRCAYWKAYYPISKDRGHGPIDPWEELSIWQWTSTGSIPGVHSAGLDMNDLLVPLDRLLVGHTQAQGDDMAGWIKVPRWISVEGGRTNHYRVVPMMLSDPPGVLVQGKGRCTLPAAEVDGDGVSTVRLLGGDGTAIPWSDITGVDFADDDHYLIVGGQGWNTWDFELPGRYAPPAAPPLPVELPSAQQLAAEVAPHLRASITAT